MIRGLRVSPDGHSLAFGYCPPGGPDRLVLLPAQGGDLKEIVGGTFTGIDESHRQALVRFIKAQILGRR